VAYSPSAWMNHTATAGATTRSTRVLSMSPAIRCPASLKSGHWIPFHLHLQVERHRKGNKKNTSRIFRNTAEFKVVSKKRPAWSNMKRNWEATVSISNKDTWPPFAAIAGGGRSRSIRKLLGVLVCTTCSSRGRKTGTTRIWDGLRFTCQ
jgi:hypothetical protein